MTDSEGRFDDGKAAAALRTIGEVSKALGIRQHVLRYWEEQFPMLKPLKRSGGRRYYRPEDVSMVEVIDRLVHREGYTLKGARKALSGKGGDAQPVQAFASAAQAPVAASEAVLHRLTAIRNELAAALAA
jgi:DNA-binding transcriptional MerR regulator